MSKFLTMMLALGLSALGVAAEITPEPGEKTAEIKCQEDRAFSYILYFPKTFDAQRAHPWPVMFILSPGGGSAEVLDRYIPGADRNQFVLAVSIQSSNDNPDGRKAVLAMVDDVLANCPAIDPERCYASGFSGGCRRSFWLSNDRKKNIVGILACGAGCVQDPFNQRAAVYGLCGSKCFNRWDMAITFCTRIKKNGKLVFFPGAHTWAPAPLLAEGMDWLNWRYLTELKEKAITPSLAEERAAFAKMIADTIAERREIKPEYAYDWSLLLAQVPVVKEAAVAKADAVKLAANPKVKLYLQAAKEVEKFIRKHFNTSNQDFQDKPVTKSMTKDANELREKYGDTPFAETLIGFGESAGL